MIKTCNKCSFLVFLLLSLGILDTKHRCTRFPSTYLVLIFHYFYVMFFVLFSPIKKESHLILGNFCIIYCNYTQINFINAIFGNPTLPFKMEIRLVYNETNVCVKIQKVMTRKNKLYHKKTLTLQPFFMDGFNYLKGKERLRRDSLLFTIQFSRSSWYSIDRPRKDERLS